MWQILLRQMEGSMHQLGPTIRIEITRVRSNLLLDQVGCTESARRIKLSRQVVRLILDLAEESSHRDQLPFFGIGRKRKANFLFHATSISIGTKLTRFHLSYGGHIFSG